MRILVVVATEFEVAHVISEFGISISEFFGSAKADKKSIDTELFNTISEIEHPKFEISLLITGVGMVATAFALGKHLSANKYDLVLNLGIAGSFDRNIALGDVVEITEDTFAELGAEDDADFLSIDTMGFGEGKFYPSKKLTDLYNLFNTFNLKQAAAITVNTVHGNEASIKKVTERLHPQVESMEGAAFFYACKQMDVPCLQIRAVSNYVEKRNRDNWNIGLAIKNLNTFAIEFLKLYA
ncbi:futalosine hydrolase [Mucilaginibacter sp. OK098]|uniref:futalosine hydrolase n=1 Tax=Mucilaginibacter sp. OK098 TaxID=1855297 RepID=UPI000920B610|nr:futalosine hydrolase [Mucilaginibacter sp. OK098]SHN35259.1 futalosine hydrolase [Mucilaginibacter sp. OK098]